MTPTPDDKTHVQAMFGRIARRYDLMNRLMTAGQDRGWRRFLVKQAQLSDNSRILDIASGTGDIAFEVRRQYPHATVVAADFTVPMMRVGQTRPQGQAVFWSAANALQLPFAGETFDAVVSGFLLRNVPDLGQTLREQHRVLKPGGWAVTLDTTPPPSNFLRPFTNLYVRRIVPLLGRLVARDPDAYAYLSGSTLAFESAEHLAALFEQAGLINVSYRRLSTGAIAVHWGQKPLQT